MKNPLNHSSGLVLFSQIVRYGSLSATATQLGVGRAAISKQLSALEERIGARLLQRSTRKLSLTHVGAEVLVEARKIEQALSSVESISDNHQNRISGKLKVSCSNTLGRTHLVPLLKSFAEDYPDIAINLQLEDRVVDLIAEQVDVAIRIGHLQDSSLIARKLGRLTWRLCASPDYLQRQGTPKTPAELVEHNCLYYRNSKSSMNTWGFIGPKGEEHITVNGNLTINDATGLVNAAVNGMGILNIDNSIVRKHIDNGELLELLPGYQRMEGLPVYIIYPAKEFIPARTQAFIDFLLAFMRPKL